MLSISLPFLFHPRCTLANTNRLKGTIVITQKYGKGLYIFGLRDPLLLPDLKLFGIICLITSTQYSKTHGASMHFHEPLSWNGVEACSGASIEQTSSRWIRISTSRMISYPIVLLTDVTILI